MRRKREQINFPVLSVIITLFISLALTACAFPPWHRADPWYAAYDFNSREDMISIASVPVLIKALEDEEVLVRVEAAKTLAEIGPDAKDAVPALIEALKDDDYILRQAAADALEAIELKLKIAGHEEETGKVNVLVQTVRLESRDWLVQREAVNQLIDIKQDIVVALPALIRVMEDRSNWHPNYNEILRRAVTAVGKIGPEARVATPALIKMMDNKDYEVRREVVKALGKIGPESDTAVIEALTRALRGDPELIDIRHVFAGCLPSNFEHLAYKGMLRGDPDRDVRREAAVSLGKFGAHAVSALPALLDAALIDIDDNVRRQAAFSLCRIQPGGESAMIALGKAINDKNAPFARETAVLELRNAWPEYRESWLPRIIYCLDDIEEGVRLNAIKTLAAYEIGSDMVCKALYRVALEDKSLQVKKEAGRTLHFLKNGLAAE